MQNFHGIASIQTQTYSEILIPALVYLLEKAEKKLVSKYVPGSIYLFRVSIKGIEIRCEIYLNNKTPKRCGSGYLLLTLNRYYNKNLF